MLCSHSVLLDFFFSLWTVAHQAPLPMRFPRQEHWSELPFPPPGHLPDSGMELASPAMQEITCNTGDPGSIPELGRSPGEGNGNSLQCSCLGNPMDRGPVGLQPMRLQRVRHDLTTAAAAAADAKSLQSCPTLCDPIDGSPPGSPVPGILQARTLEWVAISFSNA